MASLTPGRQSPFRRQPSTNSPTPLRASTPTTSPLKPSLLSPARGGSVPPEINSPLTGRLHNGLTTRPASPVVRVDEASRRDVPSPTKERTDIETPTKRFQNAAASLAAVTSPSDVFDSPPTQIKHSPVVSAQPKMRQPVFETINASRTPHRPNNTYNSIPAPLLRSFRESFEVLDPNATGTLDVASLPPVLEQIGLSNDAALSSFFPNQAQTMNLAAYLDSLSAPYSQLSSAEELAAAFSAFDIDDSGQIDVDDLRHALLRTMPEPGEANPGARLSEGDVDSVLDSFTGRRAFGSRGYNAQKSGTAKGDVFRWRDFVANLNGGSEERQEVAV